MSDRGKLIEGTAVQNELVMTPGDQLRLGLEAVSC